MQQVSTKGSILLWAMMLSIIVVVSFMGVSLAIQKKLLELEVSQNSVEELFAIENSFLDQENQVLQNGSSLSYEENQNKLITLQKGEHKQLLFSGSSNFSIDLGIVNGGAVEYQYHMFPDASTTFSLTASGILNYSESFSGTLDSSNNKGILYLNNLGGYSEVLLQSGQDFILPQRKYSAAKKIGNVNVISSQGSVENFIEFSFGIEY